MLVRTVGEQSYRIKELKLRFYNCQNMFAPKDEVLSSAASLETIIIRQLRSAHNEHCLHRMQMHTWIRC